MPARINVGLSPDRVDPSKLWMNKRGVIVQDCAAKTYIKVGTAAGEDDLVARHEDSLSWQDAIGVSSWNELLIACRRNNEWNNWQHLAEVNCTNVFARPHLERANAWNTLPYSHGFPASSFHCGCHKNGILRLNYFVLLHQHLFASNEAKSKFASFFRVQIGRYRVD